MAKKDFNEFRFAGLNARPISNKYLTMNRVSEDRKKIVVKVGEDHIYPTKYGYALILDEEHAVFIKDWQVEQNYYGTEVLLTKQYFKVKEFNCDVGVSGFVGTDEETWMHWLDAAIAQNQIIADEDGYSKPLNPVRWRG